MRPGSRYLALTLVPALVVLGFGDLASGQSPSSAVVQAPPAAGSGRIEALLKDGWEVAGFVAASDIRTLVLLKHKSNAWLIQCSVLIDVTRNPRQVVTCYEVR